MTDIRRVLRPGQIYRHFKGNLYQIMTVAVHSETEEELVIYQKLYDDYRVHARPLDMFMSEVDHVKYPKVKQKYRFELVSQPEFQVDSLQFQWAESDKKSELNKSGIDISVETNQRETKEELYKDIQEAGAGINVNIGQGANPYLLQFLDADTYEEKKNILVSMKNHMTDRLIDDIAAAMDVTVDEGELEVRYNSLMNCVETRRKFECNRFR